jgi:uncharacterized protein
MRTVFLINLYFIALVHVLSAQNMTDFTSVVPGTQTTNFVFPSNSHRFQKIIETGDAITSGTIATNFDFTAFVPIEGSTIKGYMTINHELTPGGLTSMNLQLDSITQLWTKSNSNAVSFAPVNGTARNCSGGIMPWGNVITCEESVSTNDTNGDGYNDIGWHVEINPTNQTVVNKLWAAGNGSHENMCIHSNRRTTYFGNDANPGYLYKYVADAVDNLNAGTLYVYTGPKTGSGNWVQINNATQADRNNTMTLAATAGATVFNGVEDVEIGPDGKIYFAVKNESRIYRFNDSDPLIGTTTSNFETFVGNASYTINYGSGSAVVPWGTGNDNLAFDAEGNLWVLQDGSNNYIWVVMNDHTQAAPKVKLFGIAPAGSEPTGITFTPDFKYMFLSFQHPSNTNNIDTQIDAAGNAVGFHKDIAIAIALQEDLGNTLNTNNTGIGTVAPNAKLHVKNGDVYVENINAGVILKSPDGNCWRITVGNTGLLTATSVTCPN